MKDIGKYLLLCYPEVRVVIVGVGAVVNDSYKILVCSTSTQCCGSGSGIRCFLTPRIRDAFIPDPTYFCITAINKIC
jgi:hypothetical protein